MHGKTSIWTRIKRFVRPETETYETRRARGAGADPSVESPVYEATDGRRHGGSGQLGG